MKMMGTITNRTKLLCGRFAWNWSLNKIEMMVPTYIIHPRERGTSFSPFFIFIYQLCCPMWIHYITSQYWGYNKCGIEGNYWTYYCTVWILGKNTDIMWIIKHHSKINNRVGCRYMMQSQYNTNTTNTTCVACNQQGRGKKRIGKKGYKYNMMVFIQ